MDDVTQERRLKPLPFDNLLLNSGVVNGYNSGWMYILTITFALTGYFFSQALIMFPLMQRLLDSGYMQEQIIANPNLIFDADALRMDKNIVLVLILLIFIAAGLGLLLGLNRIHNKTLTSVITGYQAFRRQRFVFGFTVWALLLVVMTAIAYYFNPEEFTLSVDLQGILISVVIMAVLMPFQTGFEETLFRGYLMQGLAQVFRNGIIPLFVSSLLFGLAHMMNPEVDKFGWPIMLTFYTSFALFLGIITLLDEGIELAFGIHFANNLVSSILVSSPHAVVKSYSVFQTDESDPYTELMTWFVLALITFFVFRAKYRWKNYRLILK